MIPPYPPNFDDNARCGYNDGLLGNPTVNYKALKYKVQELINTKLLNFKELVPNVKNNPFPKHPSPYVNSLEECDETELIKELEIVKTPMMLVHEKMTKDEIIQEVHGFSEVCLSLSDECEELKRCLQDLISQEMVHISRSDESVTLVELLEIPYLRQYSQESPIVIYFPLHSLLKALRRCHRTMMP